MNQCDVLTSKNNDVTMCVLVIYTNNLTIYTSVNTYHGLKLSKVIKNIYSVCPLYLLIHS